MTKNHPKEVGLSAVLASLLDEERKGRLKGIVIVAHLQGEVSDKSLLSLTKTIERPNRLAVENRIFMGVELREGANRLALKAAIDEYSMEFATDPLTRRASSGA